MKIIALTGTIGSGKSTAAEILRELGAEVIESDKLGHEVLEPAQPGWQKVIENFGKEILTEENRIDREKLGKIVFSNPESLKNLERILHPIIDDRTLELIERHRKSGTAVLVIELALITKATWISMVDQIWIIKADKSAVIERLKRKGMDKNDILRRMENQTPPERDINQDYIIINNDGGIENLKNNILKHWRNLFQ
jgi:dephospho-CoA kinase